MRWTKWIGTLLVIGAIIAAIDLYFGTLLIGATTRFLWNAAVFALFWVTRTLEAGIVMVFPVLRRQAMKITAFFTGIGVGYASSVILSDAQLKKAHSFRGKVRAMITRLRSRWLALPFVGKLGVVAVLIALQVILIPTIARWVVFFPIGFLVPLLVAARQFVAVRIMDKTVGRVYRKYCGGWHRTAVTKVKSVPVVQQARGGVLLLRLQYLTAWRMWKYEPCYKTVRGRRRISLFEPVRLWWRGELNRYVGKPLFAGIIHVRAPLTYEPPQLWYENNPLGRLVIGIMMLITMFALKSSNKRS